MTLSEFIASFAAEDYAERKYRHKAFPGDVTVTLDGEVVDRFPTPEHFNLEKYARWYLEFVNPEVPQLSCKYERLFKIELRTLSGPKYVFSLVFDVEELGRRRRALLGD